MLSRRSRGEALGLSPPYVRSRTLWSCNGVVFNIEVYKSVLAITWALQSPSDIKNTLRAQKTPSSAPIKPLARPRTQSHSAPPPAVPEQRGPSLSSAPVRANTPHTGGAISKGTPAPQRSPRPAPRSVVQGQRATSPVRPAPAPAEHGQDGQRTASADRPAVPTPRPHGQPQGQHPTRNAAGHTGEGTPAAAAERHE